MIRIRVPDNNPKIKSFMNGILLCLTGILLIVLNGCIKDITREVTADQSGVKTVIAWVESEPVYLINILKKTDSYLAYRRSEETVFFNPSPDEMLKLEHVLLKRALHEKGMSIPGNSIETEEIVSLSQDLAVNKSRDIVARLKSGLGFEDVVREFKLEKPERAVRIIKGSNPGYDEAVWKAEIGEIAEPVLHYDRILIFRVLDRGVDENEDEWAQIEQIDFLFPRNKARKQLETELSKKWKVRITNLYYSALNKYFDSDYDGAQDDLKKYLGGKAQRKDLAYFLMYIVLQKKLLTHPDDKSILSAMNENLEKAIENCKDIKMIPNFHFEYGNHLFTLGDIDGAREKYRLAMDNIRMDIYLVQRLEQAFLAIDDTEYAAIAREKLQSLNEIKQSEEAKQPATKSFQTEEGIVTEDLEDN